jgi:hypothetical protein
VRCCLVSKAFRNLALPFLFEKVELKPADLLRRTSLFIALEDGCSAHVRHLSLFKESIHVYVRWESEGIEVLRPCERLLSFSTNCDMSDLRLLTDSFSRWSSLTNLWVPRYKLDGNLLFALPSLRELTANDVLFSSTSTPRSPPPFHLRLLDLLYHTSRPDFESLLLSSHSSLRELSLASIQRHQAPDLTPFVRLETLELIYDTEDFDAIGLDVASLKSVPSTVTPSLKNLTLGNSQYPDLEISEYAEQDFLRAVPRGVEELHLASSTSLHLVPIEYYRRSFEDPAILPNLWEMSIPFYDEAEEEDEAERAERSEVSNSAQSRGAEVYFMNMAKEEW